MEETASNSRKMPLEWSNIRAWAHIARPPVSIVGIVGIVVSLLVAVYFAVFYEKWTFFDIEILASTNIVEIHEETQDIDILYRGKSVRESGSVVNVLTLRIRNNGSVPIREADYTDDDPVGFHIANGQVIGTPQIIEASNDYLTEHLRARVASKAKVLFSPVILNPGDSALVRVITLQNKDETNSDEMDSSNLRGVGTLAAARVRTVAFSKPELRQAFLSKTFGGGIAIQLLRLLCYWAGAIFLFDVFVILASIAFAIDYGATPESRLKMLKEYRKSARLEPRKLAKQMLDYYGRMGAPAIIDLSELLNKPELTRQDLELRLSFLQHAKVIRLDGDQVKVINKDAQALFRDFAEFLKPRDDELQPNEIRHERLGHYRLKRIPWGEICLWFFIIVVFVLLVKGCGWL